MRNSRTRLVIGLVSLVALGSILAGRTGSVAVGEALEALTWRAFLTICALQIASAALCGLAWWSLTQGASLLACTLARWVRDGSSSVLGFIPGLGEFAGARALRLLGAGSGDATASTVVDVVTEAISQVVFTLIGVLALISIAGGNLVLAFGVAAAAAPPAIGLVVFSRSRRALDLLDRVMARMGRFLGLNSPSSRLDIAANVARLHHDPVRLAGATFLHLVGWIFGAAQVWVAAQAIGHPVSFPAALAMFSIGYAARGALFFVPMGLGVQELSFVVVGAALGVDEAVAAALSLILRARDIVLGVPATLVWVGAEIREAWLIRKGSPQQNASVVNQG